MSVAGLCTTTPATADDELTSLSPVSTATGMTRACGFFLHFGSADRAVGLCVGGTQHCGLFTAFLQWHISRNIEAQTAAPESLLPIKLLRLTRVVLRLPWSSYLCLRLRYPQTAVDASAAPHLVFPAWFLCRTRVTRFETAVMT